MLPAAEVVAVAGSTPRRALFFLHGILGRGRNLHAVARRFAEACPSWQPVLVDLKNHAGSRALPGPDTVEGCADDIARLAGGWPLPVEGLFGHSFGGKVALAAAAQVPALTDLALVDSTPGTRPDAAGSEQTLAVVRFLATVATRRWPAREGFFADAQAAGFGLALAQWLGMNLERSPTGDFTLGLDVPRVQAMLDAYFRLDAWPVLEAAAQGVGPRVHVLIGDRSDVFSASDRQRAEVLATRAPRRVTVDVLPAGHWVHVDAPAELHRALVARMGGEDVLIAG